MQEEKMDKKEIKEEKEIVKTLENGAEKKEIGNPEIKEKLAEASGNKTEKKEIEEKKEKSAEASEVKEEKIIEKKLEENTSNKGIKKIEKSRDDREKRENERRVLSWEPKTELGREVKKGQIKNIDEILESKRKILECEIVDSLIEVKSELINIGQSKGKFGGGKRRIWRQTQRKTKEGNVPTFSTLAVIGDGDGHIGISSGKSKETLPAREKAIRKAKLEIFRVKRACSGFDCSCPEQHTIPFKITGKTGSLRLTLIPAAQGTGLVVASELKKVLKLAGIKDVYSRATGKKRTTFNLVKACINALKETNR